MKEGSEAHAGKDPRRRARHFHPSASTAVPALQKNNRSPNAPDRREASLAACNGKRRERGEDFSWRKGVPVIFSLKMNGGTASSGQAVPLVQRQLIYTCRLRLLLLRLWTIYGRSCILLLSRFTLAPQG